MNSHLSAKHSLFWPFFFNVLWKWQIKASPFLQLENKIPHLAGLGFVPPICAVILEVAWKGLKMNFCSNEHVLAPLQAVRLVTELSLEYQVYDPQLWNGLLQKLLGFNMVRDCFRVKLCSKGRKRLGLSSDLQDRYRNYKPLLLWDTELVKTWGIWILILNCYTLIFLKAFQNKSYKNKLKIFLILLSIYNIIGTFLCANTYKQCTHEFPCVYIHTWALKCVYDDEILIAAIQNPDCLWLSNMMESCCSLGR